MKPPLQLRDTFLVPHITTGVIMELYQLQSINKGNL